MTQSSAESSPSSHRTMVLRECGICQSSIYPDEETTTCPSCHLTFHTECWNENFGCASYGCEQVNALKPKEHTPQAEYLPPPIEQPLERLPWNFALLGSAAIAIAVSTFTYGIPSALVLTAIIIRIVQNKRERHRSVMSEPILLLAGMLGIIGLVAGALISRYWHL